MPGYEPYKRPMAMALSAVVAATYLTRLPRASYPTATSRIPRGMPLPDSALAQNSSAAPLGLTSPPIFDAPRTFPESNASHATT
jgi:hypothetical protein